MGEYEDVVTLKEGDVRCVITKRTSNLGIEQYSYKFYRVYNQMGERKTTVWMNPQHTASLLMLGGMVVQEIERHRQE